MNLFLPEQLAQLRGRVREFMEQRVLPAEAEILSQDREGHRTTLKGLQAQAREAGLWTPHLPEAFGGLGLGVLGMAALFREMGRSFVGPKVFHCDAPDQGNMDVLLSIGSEQQKKLYLEPLVRGEITSAFCMTEPAPGAGSDPGNLLTEARPHGDDWILDGHKWYSTGGGTAHFLVVMARTGEREATMFLLPRETPGVRHVRNIPVMGPTLLDHHEAELKFEGVKLGPEAVLGGVGQGFRIAQQRLVPARLTHCMRWLGLADRTLSMCGQYVNQRLSFGKTLSKHQAVQKMICDGATAVHAGNLMTLHCALMLEKGEDARSYSSMTKKYVAQALCQVLDNAIQMHGGLGYSEDLPFALWYRWARAARIADGPDEVHQMVVAREVLAGRMELLV